MNCFHSFISVLSIFEGSNLICYHDHTVFSVGYEVINIFKVLTKNKIMIIELMASCLLQRYWHAPKNSLTVSIISHLSAMK